MYNPTCIFSHGQYKRNIFKCLFQSYKCFIHSIKIFNFVYIATTASINGTSSSIYTNPTSVLFTTVKFSTSHIATTANTNGTSSSIYTNLTNILFTTVKFSSSYILTTASINSTISNIYSIPTNVLFTSVRVDLNNTSSNIYSNFVLTSTTVKIIHSNSKRIASTQDSINTTSPITLHNSDNSSSQPTSQQPEISPGERKANINKNLIWLIVFLPLFTLIVACVYV